MTEIEWSGAVGRMVMREYQSPLIAECKALLDEHPSVLMTVATGGGKTILFSQLALEWPEDRGRVLILAHRQELIEQAADKFYQHTGQRPGIEMAERRDIRHPDYRPKVLVASIQSLSQPRRLRQFDPDEFGLIITDEAHHGTSVTYRLVTEYFLAGNPDLRCVGVTATPIRADGKALGECYASATTPWDIVTGIETGWLVDVKQRKVFVEDISLESVASTRGDLAEGDLERVLLGGVSGVIDDGQDEVRAKRDRILHGIARPLVEQGELRQGVVFTPGVQSAFELASMLRTSYGKTAEAISGETDKDRRRFVLDQFAAGRLQYVINCMVLTEGFDAPHCSLIAMCRPTKSASLYLQCLGRGTRALPGVVDGPEGIPGRLAAIGASAKRDCLVLDFCGNAGKHKLVSAADVLSGLPLTEEEREIVDRLLRGDSPQDVRAAVRQARAEVEEKRRAAAEAAQREAEERERKRRATSARVTYHTSDVGYHGGSRAGDSSGAAVATDMTDAQVKALRRLGFANDFIAVQTKASAGAIISKKQKEIEARSGAGADFLLPFGKHQGKRLADVPQGYLHWATENLTGKNRRLLMQNLALMRGGEDVSDEAPEYVFQHGEAIECPF